MVHPDSTANTANAKEDDFRTRLRSLASDPRLERCTIVCAVGNGATRVRVSSSWPIAYDGCWQAWKTELPCWTLRSDRTSPPDMQIGVHLRTPIRTRGSRLLRGLFLFRRAGHRSKAVVIPIVALRRQLSWFEMIWICSRPD
jgi:hypothetical protein